MTTREAVEITRAEAARHTGPVRDALDICAAVALHHYDKNRRNKQRHRRNAKPREVTCA